MAGARAGLAIAVTIFLGLMAFQNCGEMNSYQTQTQTSIGSVESIPENLPEVIGEDVANDPEDLAVDLQPTEPGTSGGSGGGGSPPVSQPPINPPVLIENNQGPIVIKPRDIAVNSSGTYGYVTDYSTSALYRVDLSTGQRRVVSGSYYGAGPVINWPASVVLSSDEQSAFVSAIGGVVQVNLQTGARTIVTGAIALDPLNVYETSTVFRGLGPSFSGADMLLNQDQTELIGVSSNNIMAVDLQTGDRRTLVTIPVTNTSTGYRSLIGIALIPGTQSAYVVDSSNYEILRVDLQTGVYSVLSRAHPSTSIAAIGNGVRFNSMSKIQYSPTGDLLVGSLDSIVEVDTETGNRRVVSSGGTSSVGSGPSFFDIQSFDVLSSGQGFLINKRYGDLIRFEVANGNRTLISRSSIGSGEPLYHPYNIVFAGPNRSKLVVRSDGTQDYIEINSSNGNKTSISNSTIGGGVTGPLTAQSVVSHPISGDIITGSGSGGLFKVDPQTGARSRVTNDNSSIGRIDAVTISKDGLHAFVMNQTSLYRILLSNGTATLISGGTIGSGPAFDRPRTIIHSANRNKVFVGDRQSVVAVDLATGNRSILSDSTHGSGPTLSTVNSMVIRADESKAYLVTIMTVKELNLDTGERKDVSGVSYGTQVNFNTLVNVTLDPQENNLFAVDRSLGVVFKIDVNTGVQSVVSR